MHIREKYLSAGIALGLMILAVGLRILPHPANFAPVAAIAIFGGAVLPRKLAIWAPLAAMIVSDTIIGYYDMMPLTWACYGLIALASSYWLRRPTFIKTGSLTLASSLFFFIVTNFGTWLTSGMYSHSWAGIVRCYYMALPFFRGTAFGDAFFVAALFGTYAVVRLVARSWLKEPVAHKA